MSPWKSRRRLVGVRPALLSLLPLALVTGLSQAATPPFCEQSVLRRVQNDPFLDQEQRYQPRKTANGQVDRCEGAYAVQEAASVELLSIHAECAPPHAPLKVLVVKWRPAPKDFKAIHVRTRAPSTSGEYQMDAEVPAIANQFSWDARLAQGLSIQNLSVLVWVESPTLGGGRTYLPTQLFYAPAASCPSPQYKVVVTPDVELTEISLELFAQTPEASPGTASKRGFLPGNFPITLDLPPMPKLGLGELRIKITPTTGKPRNLTPISIYNEDSP